MQAQVLCGVVLAMLSGMPEMPWREQVAYYRRRAAEYDVTSYGDLPRANRRIAALIGQLHPEGDVLEIACGTGIWTRHLATCARSVTAIDAERISTSTPVA